REDGRHEKAAAEGGLFGVGSNLGLRNAVAEVLDGGDEVARLHAGGVVLDGRRGGRQIDAGALHTGGARKRPLDRAGAGSAGHARDGQVDSFRSGGLHAATSYPRSVTAFRITSGLTRSESYSTKARSPSSSTTALVTPGVPASLRSTVRAQLAH